MDGAMTTTSSTTSSTTDPSTDPTTSALDGTAAAARTTAWTRTLASRQAGNVVPTGVPTVRRRRTVPNCPPGIVDAGTDSAFELTGALIRGGVDYWTQLAGQSTRPWQAARDLAAWNREIRTRRRPEWASAHQVVAEWPLARLRDFSRPGDPTDGVPTLVLPPQAGHDSCIVDYAAGQSQVQTAREAGCTRVHALDWIGATRQTRDATIDDYISVIRTAIDRLGGLVNLVGDCQGGWLATIYAALHPETVHTLAVAGAPIDFHAGEPLLHDWVQLVSPLGRLGAYRAAVRAHGGVLPGEFMLAGFKMLQPEAEVQRQIDLLANINDPAYLARYRRFEDWFQWTQPIAGAFYLWIVEHLFMNNELLKGVLEVGGRTVDLAEIHCPVFLLAGAKDHITPPPQVFAMADFVSTPEADVVRLTSPGGHLGLFMGRESLQGYWRPVFTQIAELSRLEAPAA